MTFTLDTHWVWDLWLADDGETWREGALSLMARVGEIR